MFLPLFPRRTALEREARLLRAGVNSGAHNEDQQAYESFEAKENVGKQISGPDEAASALLKTRETLLKRIQSANKMGLLKGWIPFVSAGNRKLVTEAIIRNEAEKLAYDANPELAARGRLRRFLTLGWYRDAMFLAHVEKTKKELTQNLLKSMETSLNSSISRRNTFTKMRDKFGKGTAQIDLGGRTQDEIRALFQDKVASIQLVDVSKGDRNRIIESLKAVDSRVDARLQKFNTSIPAKYKVLLQRELDLRSALDGAGIVPLGEEMDRLIEENRNGSKALIQRIKERTDLDRAIRDTLVLKANELRGSNAIGRFFRGAPSNYYSVLRAVTPALNVLPLDGRLKHLRDAEDIDVLYRKVEIQLPGDKRRAMQIKRREGDHVWLEETVGASDKRLRVCVNTKHRRVVRKGERNEFLPPVYLTERSFLYAA